MIIICSHIQTCWHEYPNCLGNFRRKKIKFASSRLSRLSKWTYSKGLPSLEFNAHGSEAQTVASDSDIFTPQLSMDSTKNSSLTDRPSLQNGETDCNTSVKFLSSRHPTSSSSSKGKIEKLAGSEILGTSTSGRNSKPVELLSPRSQRLPSSLNNVNFGPSSSMRTQSESSPNGKARESTNLSVSGRVTSSAALSASTAQGKAKKMVSSSSSRATMSTFEGRSSSTAMSHSQRSSLLNTSKEKKQGEDENFGRTSSSSTRPATQLVHQPQPALAVDDDYAFFAKYTYSSECALLGYNFHAVISQLGIFEIVSYPHDYRLISVTLAYIFFKYRIHHCDMALDLALTLMYLEELSVPTLLSFESNDAFNVVCYFAFLAHVYNADRTIRLTDWYKEMNRVGSPNTFANCKAANKYVWFLFNDVRGLRLMPDESRVKKYIQRLCAAPQPQLMSSSKSSKTAQDKKK